MRKKYLLSVILLIVILAIAIPISYFIAYRAVSDAVYKLGFATHSGSITLEPSGATFTGEFVWENSADIPLTIDLANIRIFIYGGAPYDGTMHFMGPPGFADSILIGNVIGENKVVPAHGQVGVSATFDVTSEDAFHLIHSGNYNVGGSYYELTVSGLCLFWHITPPIYFM